MSEVDNRKLGTAGELRVASELLLRGFSPSKSFLEAGADIVLENGLRIEVKTSNLCRMPWSKKHTKEAAPRYCFNFKVWKGMKNGFRKQSMSDLKGIDYVIMWCAYTDDFYIVPAGVVRGKIAVRISRQPTRRNAFSLEQYKNKWELLRR